MPRKPAEAIGTRESSWSPNQLAKREHIIQATRQLMAGAGPHACTARAIADASGVSTSALHYYFQDVWEVKDIAFRRIFDGFMDAVMTAVNAEKNTVQKIWAGAAAFLEYNIRQLPSFNNSAAAPTRYANLLWLEYQTEIARYGSLTTVVEYAKLVSSIFPPLFAAARIENGDIKADAFFLALVGATERELLLHRDPEDVLADLAVAFDLPPCKRRTRK